MSGPTEQALARAAHDEVTIAEACQLADWIRPIYWRQRMLAFIAGVPAMRAEVERLRGLATEQAGSALKAWCGLNRIELALGLKTGAGADAIIASIEVLRGRVVGGEAARDSEERAELEAARASIRTYEEWIIIAQRGIDLRHTTGASRDDLRAASDETYSARNTSIRARARYLAAYGTRAGVSDEAIANAAKYAELLDGLDARRLAARAAQTREDAQGGENR